MELLNRISIRGRMILSFTLKMILFVLFALFSIYGMSELGELTSTLYEHPLRVSNAAIEAKAGVVRMHRSMKDVSMSATELDFEQALQAVMSEEKEVYRNLAVVEIQILGEEGKHLAKETIEMFAGWKPIRLEVETFVMQGDHAAAGRVTREKGADYVARLERQMTSLTAYARNKADGFMQSAQAVQYRIKRNTVVFIAGVGLLVFLITLFIMRSILSSLNTLRKTMAEITETGQLIKSDLAGNNEVVEMSHYFNGLVDKLQAQFWYRRGLASLNQRLSGYLTSDDVVKASIPLVSRHVEACSGAIYTFHREESVYALSATYALTENNHMPGHFKHGEGVIGQVAAEQKPMLLKDINPTDAVVRTGTLDASPRSIYAVPLVYEKKLYGVMEVALFTGIDQFKQEFVDAAANIVSTFLYAAAQSEHNRQLLSATQAAKQELEAQSEELQTQAEELQQSSDELQEQNIELDLQRQQVEEANRLKSEFLSNMSHELRTPLNSIMALSRVLMTQAGEKLSDEEINYLEIIARNGQNLLSLINDILDLSKIEAGSMDVQPKLFSLPSTLDMILERLEPVANEKGIELVRKTGGAYPPIDSDEQRVHQILQNLIGNAVKFTEQGRVTVSTGMNGDQIHVEVADTGIGISEKDLPYIFDEFRQVDGTASRQYEGTGLGLAISHKAARILGGDLSVTSTFGQGSVFSLRLPIQWKGHALVREDVPAEIPLRKMPRHKTVLVADSSPQTLTFATSCLSREGYYTIAATSAGRALKLARKYQPFAMILDIMLADMDGFVLLDLMEDHPETKDLPVIVATAKDLTSEERTALEVRAVSVHDRGEKSPAGLMEEISDSLAKVNHSEKQWVASPANDSPGLLLVEDNDAAIVQIRVILEGAGYGVEVASNGQEAIDHVAETIPDGIILDLMMPEMDGFEVLERIRGHETTRHIPVLILTAKDLSADDLKRLSANNVQQLVHKGDVDPQGLLLKIHAMLGPDQPSCPTAKVREASPLSQSFGGSHSKTLDHRPVIVVVEDNIDNRATLKAVLQPDYQILEAGDGETGLALVRNQRPDLVLLDMSLPGIDGYQVAGEIKKDLRVAAIPVIALTAHAMRGDRQKAMAAGCDAYASKPVDADGLLKLVKQWLA